MVRQALRRLGFGFLVALLVLTATPAIATVTPEKVLGVKGIDEWLPFSNSEYLIWLQNSAKRPKHYDAFAQSLTGGSRIKLNAAGTQGYPGGFDPGTNTVIYQQAARSSNLFFYNLDTQERTPVPGVNTRAWEWSPRISTSYVLFQRGFKRNGTWYDAMLLYDRNTGKTRRIGLWRVRGTFQPSGSVGEFYASWTLCTNSFSVCHAYVYDIAADTVRRIPTSKGRFEYAPVVDEVNGDVYFVTSGTKCGANVAIWRLPVADFSVAPIKIVDFSDGIDTDWVMSVAPNDSVEGSQDAFFARWVCRRLEQGTDLFVARDVTSVPGGASAAAVTSHRAAAVTSHRGASSFAPHGAPSRPPGGQPRDHH